MLKKIISVGVSKFKLLMAEDLHSEDVFYDEDRVHTGNCLQFSQPQLIVPFGHFCQMPDVQSLWVPKYAGRLIFIVNIHPM